MSNSAWAIIFLAIIAAIGGVLTVAYYSQLDWEVPQEVLEKSAQKQFVPAPLSQEEVVRLQVQLSDSDPQIRLEAILMLTAEAEEEPERLGPVLVESLDNSDPKVRSLAGFGLGRINYSSAAVRLTALLDDVDKRVRLQARETLVKLDQAGLAAVMQALRDNSIGNIDEALSVARRITGRPFGLGKKGRETALKYWAQEGVKNP